MSTATAPDLTLPDTGRDIDVSAVQKLPLDLIACGPIKDARIALDAAHERTIEARRAVEAFDPHALMTGGAIMGKSAKRIEAEQADARAFADAANAGKKDPGPVNVRRYESELSDAMRQHDGAKLLEGDRLDDLREAVDNHGGEWMGHVEEQIVALSERFHEVVDELQGVAGGLGGQRAIHAVLGGRLWKPGRYRAEVIMRDKDGIEAPHDVAEVIATLRTLGQKPRPGSAASRGSQAGLQRFVPSAQAAVKSGF
jgi:hypothetical protein